MSRPSQNEKILTDEIVNDIRKQYSDSTSSQKDLAAKYGITQTTVSRIIRGETWKHLPVLRKKKKQYNSNAYFYEG